MAEFLVFLAKINVAISAAIFVVYLLRRPIRAAFHAQIAYGLWLLVPVAALASLLPPRAVVIGSAAVIGSIDEVKLPISANTIHSMLPVAHDVSSEWTIVLFVAWLVGTCAMALYLIRLQHKFHVAERAGAAGPAVTGFFRTHIVIPDIFEAQFSARERAAILAHERAHLARQDARVNAIAALLRCLCWFNPLVHLGSIWLRRDQELACDAAALRQVSRLDYANALLKSQIPVISLPLGCAWPGSEHPLTERVTLLKRQPPNSARRRTGIFLIMLVSTFGGLGAWAAQPPTVPAPVADQAADGLTRRPVPPGARMHPNMLSAMKDKSGLTYVMTLNADKGQKNADGSEVWSGNVVMHIPTGFVTADTATVDNDKRIIKFIGDVVLTYGAAPIRAKTMAYDLRSGMLELGKQMPSGRTLTYDERTGMLDLDGKQMPSGMPKWVPCTGHCSKF